MALHATLYNAQGEKVRDIALPPALFDITVHPQVLRLALEYQRAGRHQVSGHTKTRAERRGGGKKPWKQKGTGQARQGSRRSPQWRKGGIVFGPRPDKNFTMKMNRQERRAAFLAALTTRAREKQVFLLADLPTAGYKTKPFAQLFGKLPVSRKTLLVLAGKDDQAVLSVRNLPTVTAVLPSTINVLDILSHKHLVIAEPALKVLETLYAAKRTAA